MRRRAPLSLHSRAVAGARRQPAGRADPAQFRVPELARTLDIDPSADGLCRLRRHALVEIDSRSGEVATSGRSPVLRTSLLNPATGRVHVAIGEPGGVETIDPRSGERMRRRRGPMLIPNAMVAPDALYGISPSHGGVLVLADS